MLRRLNFLLVLLLIGFSAIGSAAPAILVMGDSLSAAYGIEQQAGWVSLLQQRLTDRGYPHRVINASISGETTSGGATRIPALLVRHKPVAVIVALGANDGLRGLSLKAMKGNLSNMLQRAQAEEAQLLLIGMQLPPNYGPQYNRRFQQIFDELAQLYGAKLLPFLMQGFGDRRELFLPDALHPNATAQPLILDLVWQKLKPLLSTN